MNKTDFTTEVAERFSLSIMVGYAHNIERGIAHVNKMSDEEYGVSERVVFDIEPNRWIELKELTADLYDVRLYDLDKDYVLNFIGEYEIVDKKQFLSTQTVVTEYGDITVYGDWAQVLETYLDLKYKAFKSIGGDITFNAYKTSLFTTNTLTLKQAVKLVKDVEVDEGTKYILYGLLQDLGSNSTIKVNGEDAVFTILVDNKSFTCNTDNVNLKIYWNKFLTETANKQIFNRLT